MSKMWKLAKLHALFNAFLADLKSKKQSLMSKFFGTKRSKRHFFIAGNNGNSNLSILGSASPRYRKMVLNEIDFSPGNICGFGKSHSRSC